MSPTPKTSPRAIQGPRTTLLQMASSSKVRPLAVWALIVLVPTASAAWIVADLPPRPSPIAPSLAALAEAPAASPIPSPVPTPEVATAARGATATHALESSDVRPTDGEVPPQDSRPEAMPSPVVIAEGPSEAEQVALGRALFDRRWRPGDPRCCGGDGLGPVFNATSCLDCHREGGPGGGGPVRVNAHLLTVVGQAVLRVRRPNGRNQDDAGAEYDVRAFPGNKISPVEQSNLVNVHPGFAQARSIVLHRFGVASGYDRWHQSLSAELVAHLMETPSPRLMFRAGLVDDMGLHVTERNSTALFGSGQIDAVSDRTLEDLASKQPRLIHGRVARGKDGKVGRFGWKAQTATLRDFVLTACANELGLEVPDHHQAASPLAPDALPKGSDMTIEECDALVVYVRSLPPPIVVAKGPAGAIPVEEGRRIFDGIGCAGCHAPDLGPVQGIYSDLLLHDMGPGLADPGTYYGSVDSPGAARPEEWRTPPLWGVRDSGPYLHDGRARTLEDVVSSHGGQGEASARRFKALDSRERSHLKAFLNTLAAPAPDDLADDAAQDARPHRTKPTTSTHGRFAEATVRPGQPSEALER